MKRELIHFIKQLFAKAGVRVTRIPAGNYPYCRQFTIGDARFHFWVTTETAADWYDRSNWDEDSELQALLELASPGDHILEIGSHHAFFSLALAQKIGHTGFLLGLEADPFNALVAQAQIALNEIGKQIKIVNLAASDSADELCINLDNDNICVKPNALRSATVQAVPCDTYCRSYGPFDLVKIDVEGFEVKVAKGAEAILSPRPALAVEVHFALMRQYGDKLETLISLLHLEEYEGVILGGDGIKMPFSLDTLKRQERSFQKTNLFLRPTNL